MVAAQPAEASPGWDLILKPDESVSVAQDLLETTLEGKAEERRLRTLVFFLKGFTQKLSFVDEAYPSSMLRASTKDAKLISLWIGKHHPTDVALTHADSLGAERDKPSYRGLLFIRPQVDMKPVLGALTLVDCDEKQPRPDLRIRPDLELLGGIMDDCPVQGSCPPAPKGLRIFGVYDDLFPRECHPGSLGVEVAKLDRSPGRASSVTDA